MTTDRDQETATKGWSAPEQEPEGLSDADLQAWRAAHERVRRIATAEKWTRAEVARRADMPAPTLTGWLDGSYGGSVPNQTARLVKWLDAYDEGRRLAAQMPRTPGWVSTPTGEQILQALFYAQTLPDWAVITLGSGMGKTITARRYIETRPNAYLVTMRPTTGAVSTMLAAIADVLDVSERNPVSRDKAIGHRLKRNGRHTLLIVDEAQNLVDKAVDQLRHFIDEYGCGLALMGNNELYSRFGKGEPREGYGQIHRRIGARLIRHRPLAGDIEALIGAWKVESREIAELLRKIAMKPGALGQITKTMQFAAILAASEARPITVADVRDAWQNRGGEVS